MLYKGKLSKGFIQRAGENADWVGRIGHTRGGVRFFSDHEVIFESDEVDFAAIQKAEKRGDLDIFKAPEGKPAPEKPRRGRPKKAE